MESDPLSHEIKVVQHGETTSTEPILIVLYTTVFREGKFCSLAVDRIFGPSCPSKHRCQWSCDRQRVHQADAIIFHAYDVVYFRASLPNRSDTKPNSIWILWSDEPPSIIDYSLLNIHRFNWTMSYRVHSEVSLGTYGLFSRRDQPWSNDEYERWIDEQFFQREQGTLWFVSNCHAQRRLDIYAKLKRTSRLNVEGYGRCVDYYPVHLCSSFSPCEHDYTSRFKFYLSFESNTCRDYITEKFYKPFYYHLIPIVYGPDRRDYERVAPNNSFIHMDEFGDDIDRLVEHVQEVHSNRSLFSVYHAWRKHYEVVVDGHALERIRMCELCYRLRQVRRGDRTHYENIEQFYGDKCDRN
jgi:glycoprotein 3-alpha-L-fucosyltransferase